METATTSCRITKQCYSGNITITVTAKLYRSAQ